MKSRVHVSVAALFLLITAGLIFIERSAGARTPQDPEQTLNIERYPDEPLQLVDLKIGSLSVKGDIKQKYRERVSKWGTDSVKFSEKDDWFKRVSVTVRNTSDKPIYGVEAYLLLKPQGFSMLFSLPVTASRELHQNPLQPGTEIELSVSERMLNLSLANMQQSGADPTKSEISFSLDVARFSPELQWYRGKLLRPDSAVPHKWVPVNAP
jgi:hypothetical protein